MLVLWSCSPLKGYKLVSPAVNGSKEIVPIVNETKALLYKAQIDLYNKNFSGLIIIKKTGIDTSHLTFITELGMKMFDFEIVKNEFKMIYVFEPLNKENIINLLTEDMKLLLLQPLYTHEAALYAKDKKKALKVKNGKTRYFKISPERTVTVILVKNGFRLKEKISYCYNENQEATYIKIQHKGLNRLRIQLNKIEKL